MERGRTQVIRIADPAAIKQAADLLKSGRLVAFPTETVYGLGADAENETAIKALFRAKGRPADHPVIVHLKDKDELDGWSSEVTEEANILANKFWPGPLTIVLKRSDKARDSITGGQDTVAIRIPNHPIALALLAEFGGGLIAPSANRFGHVSPTLAEHVVAEFGQELPLVLDGGACQVGIESTIVDLSGDHPQILRPGMISAGEIADTLNLTEQSLLTPDNARVRVPGSMPRHYAPQTPLKVVSEEELQAFLEHVGDAGQRLAYAVMSFRAKRDDHSVRTWLTVPTEPARFARMFYANLRTLDASGADVLLVEALPGTPAWTSLRDRLKRAAEMC
jgi:L-threonylcarbamoyladenylate synthase